MPSVEIVEISPRVGLRSGPARLTTAGKMTLIGFAEAAGARRIEAAQWLSDKLGKHVPGMLEKAGPVPAAA